MKIHGRSCGPGGIRPCNLIFQWVAEAHAPRHSERVRSGETRVSLLPESLKSLLAQGITVVVESGAGVSAGASDQSYADAGATVTADRDSILTEADLLPLVNAPESADQARLKPGAMVIGFLRPLDAPTALVDSH